MRTLFALSCFCLAIPAAVAALPAPPDTPVKPVTDEYQGTKVTENYRWLEESNPEVKAWSKAQNARTRAYFDQLPGYSGVRARIDQLIRSNSISYNVELKRAGKLFALKIDPKKQQPSIVTLDSADDMKTEKVLLDANLLDPSGATTIDWFVVSLDGKTIAVSLSKGGSEAGDLHLYSVATGKEFGEVISHVQNGTAGGSVAFTPDGSGFWYTRYPRGNEHAPEDAGFYQQVWFHQIGTPVEKDTYELGKELPKIAEIALGAKTDKKWILAEVKNGDGGEVEFFLRSTQPGGKWQQLSQFADRYVNAHFGVDDALYLLSRADAPKGKIVRLPLDGAIDMTRATVLVPESDGAIQEFITTEHRLYIDDLLGGPSRVRMYELSGKRLADLPVLPVSLAGGLTRLEGDDILFNNGSYLALPAWYHYDAQQNKAKVTALAMTSVANFDDCEVVREFAKSKDGTMVPLNIIRRKDTVLNGKNPTILYAYGGYGVSEQPVFSSSRRIWMDHGGVYVTANIRGGGEYGDQWHLDGNLLKKQNDYDDFYACARWLIDHGYTSPEHLAIFGASNGGLLMGAALTQHPETYRAVVSRVGVYDMLRVELTSNGAFNVTEYGTVKDPAQFKALFAYSPYHHVVDGVKYPAILLATGENDPRVDPWHSRKFCARLQAASASDHPILLRTTDKAGHGMGSSLDEIIAERSDIFAFFLNELGMLTPGS